MEGKDPGTPSGLKKRELAEMISERLRDSSISVRTFLELAHCLIDLRGWRRRDGRPKGKRDLLPRKRAEREPGASAELHKMVTELEGKAKGVN